MSRSIINPIDPLNLQKRYSSDKYTSGIHSLTNILKGRSIMLMKAVEWYDLFKKNIKDL